MNLRSGLYYRSCALAGILLVLVSCLPVVAQQTRGGTQKPTATANQSLRDFFTTDPATSQPVQPKGLSPAAAQAFGGAKAASSRAEPGLAPVVSARDARRRKTARSAHLALPPDGGRRRSLPSVNSFSSGRVIQVSGHEELSSLPSLEPAFSEPLPSPPAPTPALRNDPPPPLATGQPLGELPPPALPEPLGTLELLDVEPTPKPRQSASSPATRRAVDLTPDYKPIGQRAKVSPLLTPEPLASPEATGIAVSPPTREVHPAGLNEARPTLRQKLRQLPERAESVVEEVVEGFVDEAPAEPGEMFEVATPHELAQRQPTEPQPSQRVVEVAPDVSPAQFVPDSSSPFEVIGESGRLELQMGRSKLLRMKVDVYRAAVVDPRVCDIVQYTAKEVAIIGKGHGSTHVTFWFDGNTGPMTYLVRVSPNQSVREDVENEYHVLERILAEHFPDSKVKLHPVADKLFVKGEARDSAEAAQILAIIRSHAGAAAGSANGSSGTVNAGAAARVFALGEAGEQQRPQIQVINMLRVPGVQQVALRVKIAELNRTAARGFGVDANARIEFKTNRAGLLVQSLLNASGGNAPALLANFDGTDIQMGLRTLQSHGVLRLLSEPTLVTLSGQPATFVAGGEFAVPTLVANAGANAVTTDFRAFGAIISFLPTVVDKDRIRLQVAPEFSQINSNLTVGGTPGLNVRAVSTTVEMREGQTLAIAGLLDDNMQSSSASNLPILKSILGGRDVSRTETELLILVTPELVSPMEPEETPPLPGFDVTEPTDKQFYWKGRLEGNPTWDHRSTVWPRLKRRYGAGGPAMISGPFGHGP